MAATTKPVRRTRRSEKPILFLIAIRMLLSFSSDSSTISFASSGWFQLLKAGSSSLSENLLKAGHTRIHKRLQLRRSVARRAKMQEMRRTIKRRSGRAWLRRLKGAKKKRASGVEMRILEVAQRTAKKTISDVGETDTLLEGRANAFTVDVESKIQI